MINNNLKRVFSTSVIILTLFWLLFLTWSCEKYQKNIVSIVRESSTKSPFENISNIHSPWLKQIHERELKIYSQNGEDGVLLWIFANIGTVNHPPRFVEFGTENGDQCNTRFLRQQLGWYGLMMDGNHEIPSINLHKEKITVQNINHLLAKYETPSLIDLLSIDLDFDDYFVWKSILKENRFHARVVIIEYNYDVPPNENRVVDPNQDSLRWTGTMHFGAGILALAALGRAYNYTLIYSERNGVNLFFVQTAILAKQGILHKVLSVEQLHVTKPYTGWKHPIERDKRRRWIWNDTVWR